MKRWSACLAVLVLAAGAPAQEARENPQTPREFSRATAKLLRRYEGLCTGPVVWVLAFDMSRSGMGKWSDWARQVVSDLITYCMVDGDKLVLIPFDVVVNPPRGGRPGGAAYPTWEVTEADKGRIRAESAELLLWRQDSPDGTAWVSAVEAALKATAAVPRTDQGKLGLCLVISDRDSADLIPQERSAVQAVQGVRPAGQSLWPLPRDVKPIVVYHTCSTAAPAPGTIPTRYMPPWEPPAGATNRLTPVPTPPPPPKPPWAKWLLAAALVGGGLWLLLGGLLARRRVEVRWGFRPDDPAARVTVELNASSRRNLSASAEPNPDPFWILADGATSDVQRKAVLEHLGTLAATADGVEIRTGEQYLVRLSGSNDWANQITLRRGGGPVYLELRLGAQSWMLTRQPVGIEVTGQGRDWKPRIGLGVAALSLGLALFLTARPAQPRTPLPPLPGAVPGPTSGRPTEPLCG